MTNQEALREIVKNYPKRDKKINDELTVSIDDKKSPYGQALDIALAALEKQIPQKPEYEGDGYADGAMVYDTWICPLCGKRYEVDYDVYKHCPNCGQAVELDEDK